MAKQPKFLKNLLTTASTVALLSLGATNAMADEARGLYADSDQTGTGMERTAVPADAAFTADSTLRLIVGNKTYRNAGGADDIAAVDTNGLTGKIVQTGDYSLGPVISAGKLNLDINRVTTLTGTAVAVAPALIDAAPVDRTTGKAITNPRAALQFTTGADNYSGLGDINFTNGAGELRIESNATLKGDINGGAGNFGVVVARANKNVTFNGNIGNTNAIQALIVGANSTAILNKSAAFNSTNGIGGISINDNGTLKIADGQDLVGVKAGNAMSIKSRNTNNGTLTFEGASTVDFEDGVGTAAAALKKINIGDGKVTVGANTNKIHSNEIAFDGDDSELALGLKANTEIVATTGFTTATGKGTVSVNGNNVIIKTAAFGNGGNNNTKLEAIRFDSDNALILRTNGAVVGPVANAAFGVKNIGANTAHEGKLVLGLGTQVNIVDDIGVTADGSLKSLKHLVLHSNDGANTGDATYNLGANKKIYAQTVNLAGTGVGASRNNKLELEAGSGVHGNVETTVDGGFARAGLGGLGEIHVKGADTFVTGNIGDKAAFGDIKSIVFDAAGDISIGTENDAGEIVNTREGIQFNNIDGTVKFLRKDADITVKGPIVINAGQSKGTLKFAAQSGHTVTINSATIDAIGAAVPAANTMLTNITTAGANVKIDTTPLAVGGLDAFNVDTIDVGDNDATLESAGVGGSLTIKTFRHKVDQGAVHINGSDLVVAEGGSGLGKLREIKFSTNNNLTFKAGQGDLSLSGRLIANNNGVMVFEKGETVLKGAIGSKGGTDRLNGLVIGVANNETKVTLTDNDYFVGDLTLGQKGNLILKGTELAANSILSAAAGAANDESKITFSNTEDFTYIGNIGAGLGREVGIIEITGANVKLEGDVAAGQVKFTSKDIGSTLDVTEAAVIESVTTASTAKNHNVKIDVNKIGNVLPVNSIFGSKDNQMGTLILANDGPLDIKTAKFFGSVAPTANNLNNLKLSATGGVYNNIGTKDFAVKSLEIASDQTIGNVNSKKITLNDNRTVTYFGKVSSEEGMTVGTPGGAGGNVKFIDGSELATKLMTGKDQTSAVSFNGATTINQEIGAKDKRFAKISIIGTADKMAELTANIFTSGNVPIKYTKISAENNQLVFSSGVTGENDELNLASNGIKFTSGPSNFSGKTAIKTTFNGTDVGKIITEGAGVTAKFTGATDGSTITIVNGSKTRLRETQVVNIKMEGEADSIDLGDKFTIANDPKSPVKAKIIDIKKGSIEISDNSSSANDKILESFGVDARVRENANAWFNAKAGEAKGYADEVFQMNIEAPEKSVESQKRISNPIVSSTEAVSLVTTEAANIITSRIQTIANPAELRVSSIEGVSAGEEDVLRHGIWGSPFINYGRQKAKSGVSGYRSKSLGGTIGFDNMANDTMTVGIAATILRTNIKHKDINIGDKTNANTLMFSVYGLQQFNDQFFLQGVASFGSTKIKNRALRVGFKSGADYSTAVAKYDSMSWGGEVVGGYNVKLNDMAVVTPMIGVDYTRINDSGYTETGTRNQNLTVNKRVNNNIQLLAGARGVMAATNFNDFIVTPELHAFVRQNLHTKTPQVSVKLDGQASPINAKVAKQSKTLFNIGGGVNMTSGSLANTEFGITYDASFAKKYVGHQGALKVRVNF